MNIRHHFMHVLGCLICFFAATCTLPAQVYSWTNFAGKPGGSGNADGSGAQARFDEAASTAVDSSGNVYVADSKNHTIRKITPSGVVTTFAGTAGIPGSADGTGASASFNAPISLAYDVTNNLLYVADSENHTIRKITTSGEVSTVAGLAGSSGSADGSRTTARFNSPQGLAVDSAGDLYVADFFNHTIRKITTAGTPQVSTLAGSPGNSGITDGSGSNARFNSPTDVAVAGGIVYVADFFNHTIRKIDGGGNVTTLAGSPEEIGSNDGTGSNARFSYPSGLAIIGTNQLFVADQQNHNIRAVNAATGAVTTLVGTSGVVGNADGTGGAAQFNFPRDLAADSSPTPNLYVADLLNHTVRKIASGNGVTTLAGDAADIGAVDATGTSARFTSPVGLTVDANDNLYVTDQTIHTIRRITPSAEVTTLAGIPDAPGSDDGDEFSAKFKNPSGLVALAPNLLAVADTDNQTIRKINLTPSTNVTTFAGQVGISGIEDGIGVDAQFQYPEGIAAGASGTLYIADSQSHIIRQVTSSGAVSTLAGSPENSGTADGTGTDARFNNPLGIVYDSSNNCLYVADTYNHTIRKVTLPGGAVTTLAGSPGASGSTNGTGSAARFNSPSGLALDPARRLWVADTGNNTLRVITFDSTPTVTTVGGTPGVAGGRDGVGPNAHFNAPRSIAINSAGVVYVTDLNNYRIVRGEVTAGPEIAVEQPAGTNLESENTVSLGGVIVNQTRNTVFTIRNIGVSDLGSISVTKSGTHASEFLITTLPATSLTPETSTTFTIQFAPTSGGSKTANLQISSNDANENPFLLTLTGTGLVNSDNDEASDAWETAYGFNPNLAGDIRTLDSDNDGVKNIWEIFQGSNRNSASSRYGLTNTVATVNGSTRQIKTRYRISTTQTAVAYTPVWTDNLATAFTSAATRSGITIAFSEAVVDSGTDYEIIELTATVTAGSPGRLFISLNLTPVE